MIPSLRATPDRASLVRQKITPPVAILAPGYAYTRAKLFGPRVTPLGLGCARCAAIVTIYEMPIRKGFIPRNSYMPTHQVLDPVATGTIFVHLTQDGITAIVHWDSVDLPSAHPPGLQPDPGCFCRSQRLMADLSASCSFASAPRCLSTVMSWYRPNGNSGTLR